MVVRLRLDTQSVFAIIAGGRLLTRQDQKGDTVTWIYDLASRVTERQYPDAQHDSFAYDASSRMTSATSTRYSNVVSFTYDDASRLLTESLTVGGETYPITHTYDLANRRTLCTYPDGSTVERDYTDRSQTQSVTYDPDGAGPGPRNYRRDLHLRCPRPTYDAQTPRDTSHAPNIKGFSTEHSRPLFFSCRRWYESADGFTRY